MTAEYNSKQPFDEYVSPIHVAAYDQLRRIVNGEKRSGKIHVLHILPQDKRVYVVGKENRLHGFTIITAIHGEGIKGSIGRNLKRSNMHHPIAMLLEWNFESVEEFHNINGEKVPTFSVGSNGKVYWNQRWYAFNEHGQARRVDLTVCLPDYADNLVERFGEWNLRKKARKNKEMLTNSIPNTHSINVSQITPRDRDIALNALERMQFGRFEKTEIPS